MKHKLKSVSALAATLITIGSVPEGLNAAVLAGYSFPGGNFAATVADSGISAGDVNTTGSSATIVPGFILPDTIFFSTTVVSATAAEAITNAQFFQFSITPTSGNAVLLEELTFDFARGGSSTPRGFELRTSLDGFAATISTANVPTVQPSLTPFSIDLTGSEFQNIETEITFRFYVYTPSIAASMFSDNIVLNGSVVAVPEPSSALLLGIGALGLVTHRRRNK